MRLTSKQQRDLQSIKYFIPSGLTQVPLTPRGIEMFFEYSDKGMHRELLSTTVWTFGDADLDTMYALSQGKIWRGRHTEIFEVGILDGSMPWVAIIGNSTVVVQRQWWQLWKPRHWTEHRPTPRAVVDFMKKEMFQGVDSDIIERCHQSFLRAANDREAERLGFTNFWAYWLWKLGQIQGEPGSKERLESILPTFNSK